MPVDIIMPSLSPTMEEGIVSNWLAKEGDSVKEGDVIAEIETDKAIMEMEAMDSGRIAKIFAQNGSSGIKVGHVIGVMLLPGESDADLEGYNPGATIASGSQLGEQAKPIEEPNAASSRNKAITKECELGSSVRVNTKVDVPSNIGSASASSFEKNNLGSVSQPVTGSTITSSTVSSLSKPASPLARRIAGERGVNINDVYGSGTRGRVVKRDIELFSMPSNFKCDDEIKFGRIGSEDELEVIELSRMRKVVGQRLSESKSQIPHFYLSIECEISQLLDMRKSLNIKLNEKYQNNTKVSVNDLIIKAVGMSLVEYPEMNVSFIDGKIQKHSVVDICIAISLEESLIAPRLCDVNLKDVISLSRETKDLIQRAREQKIKMYELHGASISISNLGMMGIDEFFPIVNPPQASIIGIGRISKRPTFDKNGNVIEGNFIRITSSADHRAVDGADVARFLEDICDRLSNPISIFLDI